MRLSQQQIEQYRETGCLVVDRFFAPREVEGMRAELERFKAQDMLRNVATEGDGVTPAKKAMNLQIVMTSDKSDLLRALPWHADLRATVRELVGGPYMFYLDQIFLKPGRHGAGTNWHQDNAYFKTRTAEKGIGVWIALHQATKANGTLQLIPNSHREALVHERDPGSDHHVSCKVDGAESVYVEVEAGGVAFFNWGIAHCTGANETDQERAGLAYHFIHLDHVPEDASKQTHTMAIMDGPRATGGEREWGKKIEGTWEQELTKVLGR
jgi:ectoine hydroxylase-related dioxygenase (phytanoyl-CoA dioxygenase family)